MAELMSDARLAEIREAAAQYRGSTIVRRKRNSAIAHRAELLAEMDRLRTERNDNARLAADFLAERNEARVELKCSADLNRELVNESAQWQSRAEKAERDVERWNRAATLLEAGCIVGKRNVFETIAALTERAETAERELAELRELLGDAKVEWASDAPGFFFTTPFSTEDDMRRHVREVREKGGDAVLKRRLAGEWRTAEHQTEEQE